MPDPYLDPAILMASRMRWFKAYSAAEEEIGNPNFWEPADQKALDAFDKVHKEVLDSVSGVPLPLEYSEAT